MGYISIIPMATIRAKVFFLACLPLPPLFISLSFLNETKNSGQHHVNATKPELKEKSESGKKP
jgi:hypothetical protein